ncbi:MAG TPA: hypothetical protein VKE94_15220, partial [Gemmataceae bacterium]|nr:hypothetical protein [Gemmataceae bacterium]
MSGMLARSVTTSASIAVFFSVVWMASSDVAQDRPAAIIAASKAELLAMTPLWKGERYADGRPKFPDDLLQRMKAVSIEDAWELLRKYGYHNQFEGGWKILRKDKPLVGRALTAAYLPSRPDLDEHILRTGKAEARIGRP